MKKLVFIQFILAFFSLSAQEVRLGLSLGHSDLITSAEFSPDGKFIVTTSDDNTARLWDVRSSKLLRIFHGHLSYVNSAEFSPDGKKIVSTSGDWTARIWDVNTGKILHILKDHEYDVCSAKFSPDGKTILTTSLDKTAFLWDVATGKLLHKLYDIYSANFSSDGKFFVTISSDNTARVWDVVSAKLIHILKVDSGSIFSDGKKILTESSDNITRLYDASTGKIINTLMGHDTEIKHAVFSHDGKSVITVSENHIVSLWNLITGKLLNNLIGHKDNVNSVEFSLDDKTILTYSNDESTRLWNAISGKLIHTLDEHETWLNSAKFSPDGKTIVTVGRDLGARLWDVNSGKLLQSIILQTYSDMGCFDYYDYENEEIVCNSPDGKTAITLNDKLIRIWDVFTDSILYVKEGHYSFQKPIYSKDSKSFVTVSDSNTVQIWDVATGKILHSLIDNTGEVISVEFSPDGNRIVILHSDHSGYVWDLTKQNKLYEIGNRKQLIFKWNANISPDGKTIATCSSDFTAHIWNTYSGKLLHTLKWKKGEASLSHLNWDAKKSIIPFLLYSPDAKTIFTATPDHKAQIWDVNSGKLLMILQGSEANIDYAEYTADGKTIITTSADGKTIFWDATTGKILYTRIQLENNDWLVYDEHYRFDGTPGALEKLYFVCGTEIIELWQVKQSLRVRNLYEKIINKEDLSGYKKLSDLDLCGKLPLVEQIGDRVSLRFSIEKRSVEILRIEVLVDKKIVKTINPGTLKWENNKAYLSLDSSEIYNMLVPGSENKIKIQVVSLVDGEQIPNRGVSVLVSDNREQKKPTLYGVFIGVEEYNSEKMTLSFPGDDALSIAKAVQGGASALLDSSHVKIYTIHSLCEKGERNGYGKPTRNTVRKVFEEIGSLAEPQDILFVFLAGHGTMGDKTDKKFTFLTSEATFDNPEGFNTDTLFSWIGSEGPFKLKANKAILVIDACNSGQIYNDLAIRSTDEEEQQKQLDQLSDRTGMYILSASAPNRSAYEHPQLEHGLLTYSLLRVLKQNTEIYETNDYVNMTKWFYESTRDLERLTKELNLEQEAVPYGKSDFQLLKIDKMQKDNIELAEEKQQFYIHTPENEYTELSDNDFLKRLLKEMESDVAFKKCFYRNKELNPEALSVKIKYKLKGNEIICRILFFQDNSKLDEIQLTGNAENWQELELKIISTIKVMGCK